VHLLQKILCIERRIVPFLFCFLLCATLSCPPAAANAGIPMLFVVWPSSWVLLFAIIPIESYVAARILKLPFRTVLKAFTNANLISTFVGIPITWIILVAMQMLSGGGSAWGLGTTIQKILSVTVQSPWLIPYSGQSGWMVPAAGISLCIPFYFVSVWVELRALNRILGTQSDGVTIRKAAWVANLVSYGLILIGLVILTVAGALLSPDPTKV